MTQGYYEALFQAASQGAPTIGGAQAVQFFAKSKLPIEVLKNVWTVADQPSTSSLDRQKFAIAIRLIQFAQNGLRAEGANLAAPPGAELRPVQFEGFQPPPPPPPGPGGPPPPQQQPNPAGPPQQPPTPAQQPQPMLSPTPSNAIVAQDPYGMTPQERGRYETLFPQYAKEDGYMYGKEAVELFSKSGVDMGTLRDLWNMVDTPADSRLDKLEFAISMHLIVCISKKNLPKPTVLPISLKELKRQEAEKKKIPAAPQLGSDASTQQQQPGVPPPPQQQQPGIQGNPSFDNRDPNLPPVVSTGGMSISDAFEGLTTASGDHGSLPAYVPENEPVSQPPPTQQLGAVPMAPVPEMVETNSAPLPTETGAVPLPVPTAVGGSSQSVVSNYDMSVAQAELDKLRSALQKLQAENVSLKAQVGTMNDEEKDVQKEISATVAEISTLSNQLTGLRAEVLAAKTRLIEANAELKAAKEKKE